MKNKFYIPVTMLAEDFYNETCFFLRNNGFDNTPTLGELIKLVRVIISDSIFYRLKWTNLKEESPDILLETFTWWNDEQVKINVNGIEETLCSLYNRVILDKYELLIKELINPILNIIYENPWITVHSTDYKNDMFIEIGVDYRILEFEKQRTKI